MNIYSTFHAVKDAASCTSTRSVTVLRGLYCSEQESKLAGAGWSWQFQFNSADGLWIWTFASPLQSPTDPLMQFKRRLKFVWLNGLVK